MGLLETTAFLLRHFGFRSFRSYGTFLFDDGLLAPLRVLERDTCYARTNSNSYVSSSLIYLSGPGNLCGETEELLNDAKSRIASFITSIPSVSRSGEALRCREETTTTDLDY